MHRIRGTRSAASWLATLLAALAAFTLLVQPSAKAPNVAGAATQEAVFLPMVANVAGAAIREAVFLPMVAKVVPNRFGVWTGGGDSVSGAVHASKISSTGASWDRTSINWNQVDLGPQSSGSSRYNFSVYDGYAATLGSAGVNNLMEIRGNPTWAATDFCGPIDKTGGMAAFGAFVEALVTHYSAAPYNVHNYEFYNEPDWILKTSNQTQASCFGSRPAQYVELLRTAYTATKKSDPASVVFMGGLGDEHVNDAGSPRFNQNFLDQMLAAGGGSYFDVVNFHYFSTYNAAWAPKGIDIIGKTNHEKEIVAKYGLQKKYAVTELSWTDTTTQQPSFQEAQARYVPKVFARGYAADLYAMNWFALTDFKPDSALDDVPYGIYDYNLNPKPSRLAYLVATREFGAASASRTLTQAELGVSTGIEGYVFLVNGHETWVVWSHKGLASEEGGSVPVTLPGGLVSARDKLGNSIQVAAPGQGFTLTEDPIYLHLK